MVPIRDFPFHVLEAILTCPQLVLLSVLIRIWRVIPCVYLKPTYLDHVNIFDFCHLIETDTYTVKSQNSIALFLTASCSLSKAAVVGSISAIGCGVQLK